MSIWRGLVQIIVLYPHILWGAAALLGLAALLWGEHRVGIVFTCLQYIALAMAAGVPLQGRLLVLRVALALVIGLVLLTPRRGANPLAKNTPRLKCDPLGGTPILVRASAAIIAGLVAASVGRNLPIAPSDPWMWWGILWVGSAGLIGALVSTTPYGVGCGVLSILISGELALWQLQQSLSLVALVGILIVAVALVISLYADAWNEEESAA